MRTSIRAGLVLAAAALAGCRDASPTSRLEQAVYRDLLVDPEATTDPAEVIPCADVTAFGAPLTEPEPELLRRAWIDAPSELLLAACFEGPAPAESASIDLEVWSKGRRRKETRRIRVAPGWSEHRIALTPRAAETRIRLRATLPAGGRLVVGDLAIRTPREVAPLPGSPSAILVSLDAFREDAIGALGGGARTPALDRLVAESERVFPHWSAEISTKPSHASMLTGLPVEVHGCDREQVPLADGVRTVAERVAERGAEAAAFASVAPFFHERFGLSQGFATYRLLAWSTRQELRAASNWLADHRGRPAFLFVHLYGAHSDFSGLPYEAPGTTADALVAEFGPGDYRCRGGHCGSALPLALNDGLVPRRPDDGRVLRYLYDRGVEALDAELGAWFDELRRAGLWDESLVIVTADHGEAFGEHGYFLHTTPHEEVLRVPLLVKWPRGARAGKVTRRPSTSIDLASTLLAFFGLPADDLVGADLARPAVRPAPMVSWKAVRDGDLKLLLETPEFPRALYDLAADPAERTNLLPGRAADAARLEQLRVRYLARARTLAGAAAPAAPRPFTPEEEQRLRSLGYLR